MAFSNITPRGSAVSTTSNNTIAMSPSANLVVGRLVIVCVTSTNFATADGASTDHSLADSQGNTWTKIAEYTETSGAAHDGTTISTWRTIVTTQIGTGDTITCTLSGNSAEKIICTFEVQRDTAKGIAVAQTGVGQTAIEASVSSLTSREYLLVGHGGSRGNDNTKTPDADYTEQFDLRSRNNSAAVANHVVTRIATLTSDTCTSTAWTNTAPIFLLHAIYETASAPTVTTQAVSGIGVTTATGNGNVTADGGATVTERGVVANTTGTPTTSDLKFQAASGGTGVFTASMTGLNADTHYYVRAYAINSEGTSYGSEVEFDTLTQPAFKLSASSYITAGGENTTAQLTAPSGKTTSDFQTGRIADDENPLDAIDLSADKYTEYELSLETTEFAEAVTYQIMVSNAGANFDTYDVIAEVVVVHGAQTYEVSMTLSHALALAQVNDGIFERAISLPRSLTASLANNLILEHSISLLQSLALTQSDALVLELTVLLEHELGYSLAHVLDADGTIALGRDLSISQAVDVLFETAILLERLHTLTAQGGFVFEDGITLQDDLVLSSLAGASFDEVLALERTLQAFWTASLDAAASLTLGREQGALSASEWITDVALELARLQDLISSQGGADLEEAISLGLSHAVVAAGTLTLDEALSLGRWLGATPEEQADLYDSILLGRELDMESQGAWITDAALVLGRLAEVLSAGGFVFEGEISLNIDQEIRLQLEASLHEFLALERTEGLTSAPQMIYDSSLTLGQLQGLSAQLQTVIEGVQRSRRTRHTTEGRSVHPTQRQIRRILPKRRDTL